MYKRQVTFSKVVSTSGGGTVVDNGDGTIDYTPSSDFNGIDTIIYEAVSYTHLTLPTIYSV